MFSNKDLCLLIIPLIIEQILNVFVGMVDTMMISSLGEAAVSGVSLVDTINVLFFTVFSALTAGGSVVAAQYVGQRNRDKACRAANQLLLAAVTAALALMGMTLIFHQDILQLIFGKIKPDVRSAADTYFVIMAFSLPFLAAYNSCTSLFRSMGNSRVGMYTATFMNLLNIVCNFIGLYLLKIGVAGVALATLLSRIAASAIMLHRLKNPRNAIHLSRPFELRFRWEILKKIFYIGIPNSLETSVFQIGKVLVMSLVTSFGTAALAANAVGNSVSSFQTMAGGAIGTAMVTVVGQCIGATRYEEAEYYIKKLMKVSYLLMAAVNGIVYVIAPFLAQLYHLSEKTLELAVLILRYHSICCMLIWPASFTIPNALRAANDVKYSMIVSILSMWIFRIGFSYLLGKNAGLGVFGIWIAMTIDWLFRGICFAVRLIRGKWKECRALV